MDFKFSDEKEFNSIEDKFIKGNNYGSWRYLPKWTEYKRVYCGSALVKDLSFLVLNENRPVALCHLFLEQHDRIKQLSYAHSYQPAPMINKDIDPKHQKKIERLCFRKIDEIAQEHNAKKAMFLLDPLERKYDYNILPEYDYLDSSISTAIVDLSLDKKQLWSDLRKSFKSLINNGENKFNIHVMDHQNPCFETNEAYRELHHKTAGRVTRSLETFQLQFDMLKDDNAVLIALEYQNNFIAFSYFFHHNKTAHYASSSDDPDYSADVPLEHCIIWTAIEYYQGRGFNFLELGWQQFSPQVLDHPCEKDLSISFFKRGFGGKILSLYRGIKYYDKEYMKRDLEENKKKFIDSRIALVHE